MNFGDFEASLLGPAPPEGLSELLRALWLDGAGDFDGAHRIAQEVDTQDGARVHAYLHRKEGDSANAGYWYRRAGCAAESGSLRGEWEALVRRLLGSRQPP
jgi:hypothetical protein